MKLYAGVDDGLYEYAVWAANLKQAADKLGFMAHQLGYLTDNTSNKALCKLVPDKTKVYRRDLGHDENPWEPKA